MEVGKAKELQNRLKEIKRHAELISDGLSSFDPKAGSAEVIKAQANLARSALDEPVCKTCNNTHEVISGEPYGHRIPCPKCQEPPASEFTKGLRQNVREFPDFPEHLRDLFERDILEACDLLDAQQQRIEELKKEEEHLLEIGEKHSKLREKHYNNWLNACEQLVKRDDAIKYAVVNQKAHDKDLFRKELKRILGDDEFERIIK